MRIKEILVQCLKRESNKMATAATVSFFGYGVEEMPQSLKEKR